ncbi:MAG TPA: ABC transporter ATP-binding protein [Clostridia bacterium]|nr:ABC transporter ATP-binding protein [Clostridia bacterium]
MEPLFTLAAVSFDYDGIPALRSLSLTVRQGERIALVGANGSGKSTLLRVLDGLYLPASGTVLFQKEILTQNKFNDPEFTARFRRAVAFVFQNPDVQLFNPTVFDEIAFGPLQLGLSTEKVLQAVNETLSTMSLESLRERPPYRLSGGEKKKVALASVLVMNPEVLLLDEPTAALDPRSQSLVVDLIQGWKSTAKTVITATHQLELLEEIADIVYVMDSGTIIASGTPASILANGELLLKANLVHEHRHKHGTTMHSHPHLHGHSHHNL